LAAAEIPGRQPLLNTVSRFDAHNDLARESLLAHHEAKHRDRRHKE
jgi:hypothetical protein